THGILAHAPTVGARPHGRSAPCARSRVTFIRATWLRADHRGRRLPPDPESRGFARMARSYRVTHQQPRCWRRAKRVREGAAPVPADWCTRSATGGPRVAGAAGALRETCRVLAKLALIP